MVPITSSNADVKNQGKCDEDLFGRRFVLTKIRPDTQKCLCSSCRFPCYRVIPKTPSLTSLILLFF